MKRRIGTGLLACLFVMIAALLPVTAFARGAETEQCALTIDFHTSDGAGMPIPDAAFRAYRTAEKSGRTYQWTAAFAECGASAKVLETWEHEALVKLADTLGGYAVREGERLTPEAEGRTDSSGKLVLEGLQAGVYLVMGDPVVIDGTVYTPAPFLVSLPSWDDGKRLTEVTAAPKYTPEEGTLTDVQVRKVWDDGGSADRPKEIVVQLLRDGEVYTEQTLSAGNNWRYTWTGLPSWHTWEIVEKQVPAGYTAKVDRSGNTFVVTNSNPPTKLPQTGQTWWPVPLLCGVGMAVFAAGLLLVRQKEEPDEPEK